MKAETINQIEILCKRLDHYKFKTFMGRFEIHSDVGKFTSNFLDKLIKLNIVFVIENNVLYIWVIENE